MGAFVMGKISTAFFTLQRRQPHSQVNLVGIYDYSQHKLERITQVLVVLGVVHISGNVPWYQIRRTEAAGYAARFACHTDGACNDGGRYRCFKEQYIRDFRSHFQV